MFLCFSYIFVLFNVVVLLLLKHKRTKWCISHGHARCV